MKFKVTTTCKVTSEYIVEAIDQEEAIEIYSDFPEKEIKWENETIEKIEPLKMSEVK